ncbi:hypothetical protein [Sulfurisphaera ohwakuensis]|uniref:hypothetical protein n=1 Tax=Sulfurisphaera ohwakuensis TaxID=69656 RepID=UPI0036F31484
MSIDEIINNPEIFNKLVSKVYEQIKNDIIIKRLDGIEELTRTTYDHVVLIWEKLADIESKIQKSYEISENYSKQFYEINKRLEEIEKILQEHSKRLEEMNKALLDHSKILEEHSKRLEELEKALREQSKLLEEMNKVLLEHTKLLEEHSRKFDEVNKRLEEHNKILMEHTKVIEELVKSIGEFKDYVDKRFTRLEIIFNSFTSRAGHHIERTMLELYKEGLILHGINASNIKHGFIESKKKGKKYEVDFYETNDYIYIFEIKNLCDDTAAIEQLENRKEAFEENFPGKKIKMFLVCNSIQDKIKELAESEGIVVITGNVFTLSD